MFTTAEQFTAAAKQSLGAQFDTFAALTGTALNTFEKVIDLNLHTVKASLQESGAAAQQFLSVKDARELFTVGAAQVQPTAQKALAYSRHLAGIASATQAEFARVAEDKITETNRKVVALVDEIAKNAPAGSENVIALVKTAVSNANAGFEQFSKTAKQAAQTVEANIASASQQFAQQVDNATARAAK